MVTADGAVRDHGGPMSEPGPFGCPRCRREVIQPYYGPCGSCRDELRATFAGRAREVVTEAYEPKMNVTPNAVATKETPGSPAIRR